MLTLTEIRAQYGALARTIELLAQREADIRALGAPRAILFTGCGSSFSVGCSLRAIAGARLDVPVYAVAAGDLWLNAPDYARMAKDALVVSVSRSGRTSELLRAYEAVKALNVGARFASVICAEGTPLEALSDLSLVMPWAFDESVCQTRCVANLYAAGALFVGALAGDAGIAKGLKRVSALGEDYMKRLEPVCEALAALPWDAAVVLADGEIDGLAEEGALAFKEISQLFSNYYHILDCRHGPMVLFSEKTLVIAAAKSPECPYERALIEDCVKKGAPVARYSALPLPPMEGVTDVVLGEDVGAVAGGLGLLAICQLTSYFKSFRVGCNPDLPDGLSPWIEIR